MSDPKTPTPGLPPQADRAPVDKDAPTVPDKKDDDQLDIVLVEEGARGIPIMTPLPIPIVMDGNAATLEEGSPQVAPTLRGTVQGQVEENLADASAIPEVPAGQYEPREFVAAGGCGCVLKGDDAFTGGAVALKLVKIEPLPPNADAETAVEWRARHEEETKKLLREARLGRQLDHPNIAPVYGVGRCPKPWTVNKPNTGEVLTFDKGEFFVVMKFIVGLAFNEFLAKGKFSLFEVVGLFREVLHGVGFAHRHGVAHRDLKPGNIRVEIETGRVCVLDLGLAQTQAALQAKPQQEETVQGSIHGTPGYMSPEQARGTPTDYRTDIFTLGIILYEMLSGRLPFSGEGGFFAYTKRVATEEPDPLETLPPASYIHGASAIPEGLGLIARKAMAKKPEDRYTTVEEMETDLVAFLSGAKAREEAEMCLNEAHALHRNLKKRLQEVAGLKAKIKAEFDEDARLALEDLLAAHHLVVAGVRAEYHDALERARDKDAQNRPALRLLAACAKADVVRAEETGNHDALAKALMELGRYDTEKRHERFRVGTGKLTLRSTLPDGQEVLAECQIFRLKDKGALRVPVQPAWKTLATPFAINIAMGSYKVVVRAQGFPDIVYPVYITRQRHWDGVVRLRTPPQGFVYVPGDPFVHKGDFYIQKDSITLAEYLEYLKSLSVDESRQRTPRDAEGPYLERNASGEYLLQWATGREKKYAWCVTPDLPVFGVSWHDANAYCAWRSQQDGVAYRLPSGPQRKKAAQGVDDRIYPWGRKPRKDYCNTQEEFGLAHARPTAVDTHPIDHSIYGVADLAGGVCNWKADTEGGFAGYEGGAWYAKHKYATTTSGGSLKCEEVDEGLGFRLVIALEE